MNSLIAHWFGARRPPPAPLALSVASRDEDPGEPLDLLVSITEPGESPPAWVTRRLQAGEAVLHLAFMDCWEGMAGHPRGSMRYDQMRTLRAHAERLSPGARVHVHCHAGRSRSTACAAAVLAFGPGPRLRDGEVLDAVAQVRPALEPNPHVLELVDELSGRRLRRTWQRRSGLAT